MAIENLPICCGFVGNPQTVARVFSSKPRLIISRHMAVLCPLHGFYTSFLFLFHVGVLYHCIAFLWMFYGFYMGVTQAIDGFTWTLHGLYIPFL